MYVTNQYILVEKDADVAVAGKKRLSPYDDKQKPKRFKKKNQKYKWLAVVCQRHDLVAR